MQVAQEVLSVLSRMEPDGNVLRISDGQLDRKLYVGVNKVLEAMGGKWNRKVRGHVFEQSPADHLDSVLLTGRIDLPKDEFGFFPTPPDLASEVVLRAELQPGMRVLEPSAGDGALARKCAAIVGKGNVFCIEFQRRNCNKLEEAGFGFVDCIDFLLAEPVEPKFDRVVMNPPFARQQDIDHVLHAWKFLKPGGRLVAIMSAGIEFRENKKTVAFRDFVSEHGGQWRRNEQGAFKESGTMVNTVTVVIDK